MARVKRAAHLIRVFHRTSRDTAADIRTTGFYDASDAVGAGLERMGVWVSDQPMPRRRRVRPDVPPHGTELALAESLRRTRHRVDPSRVSGPRDRVQRATPSARASLLSGVLPRFSNSPYAGPRHPRCPRGRRNRRRPHRGATRSRRAPPSLRTASGLIAACSTQRRTPGHILPLQSRGWHRRHAFDGFRRRQLIHDRVER